MIARRNVVRQITSDCGIFKKIRDAAFVLVLSVFGSVAFAEDHPAQVVVEQTVTQMLNLYQEEGDRLKNDPEFLQSKIDELVVPNLDFADMTRLAVSKFWKRADADQRATLVTDFTQLLLNTYTGALVQYGGARGGESVVFEPFRPESREDRAVVRSKFSQRTSRAVDVTYKLRDRDGWKIYDITVDGTSLVTSYRSAFSSEIEKGGIDGLIATIKKRIGE